MAKVIDRSRDVFPQSNLPAEAQEWRRAVEERLNITERATRKHRVTIDSTRLVQQATESALAQERTVRDEQRIQIEADIDAAAAEAAQARENAEAALADAAEALVTVDGKNSVRTGMTPPTYPNMAAGDIWYETDSSGQVIGVHIYDGAAYQPYRIVGDSLLVPSSIGTIALMDGIITTPKLATNSVTADKVTITPSNLIDDPLFTKPFGEVWVRGITGGAYYGTWEIVSTSQGNALRVTAQAGGFNMATTVNRFPVQPGERYKWSARVQTSGNAMIVRAVAFSKTGATTILGQVTIPASTTWSDFSAEFEIPADRYTVRFDFLTSSATPTAGQQAWLTDPKINRMVSAELIVDGAMDAKTITGALIRTSASGQRVELTSANYIRFYAANGAIAGYMNGINNGASGALVSIGGDAGGLLGIKVGAQSTGNTSVPTVYLTANAASFGDLLVGGRDVRAALADTGWINWPGAASGSGFSASSAAPPQYRKIGNMVYLRGQLYRASAPNNVHAFTLPAGYRPVEVGWWQTVLFGTGPVTVEVNTAGEVRILSSTARTSGVGYSMMGVAFLID